MGKGDFWRGDAAPVQSGSGGHEVQRGIDRVSAKWHLAGKPLLNIVWPVLISLSFQSTMSGQTNSYIDSTRPTISSDAAIQQRGVLQVESGYDGYFLPYDQTGQTSLYYALTNWLRLDAGLSAWRATDTASSEREVGVGNVSVGAKAVLFRDGRSRIVPGFAVEYEASLPTASNTELRSRYHQGTLIVSNSVGTFRWKVNGSLYGSGCERGGCSVHGQGALGVSETLTDVTTLQAEFFGQTNSATAPPGAYLFGGLTHKLSDRTAVNGGLRFGVTRDAPRIGVTVGFTVGVGGKSQDHGSR